MNRINPSLMDFHTAELLEAHRIMDKAQVGTHTAGGDRLSLSQRVHMLATAFAGVCLASAAISKAREPSPRTVLRLPNRNTT